MPSIQAQDIVTAVIQDSQNQTTNRVALYDYTDRIQQRILRESQWRFLLSDPQTFITMPGVGDYTLVPGPAPAGSFLTGLDLEDFGNIAPGSVYNLANWTKIEEDPDENTTLNYYLNRDGSLRYGYPRTYYNSLTNPGTITLKPVPNDENLYYPVPETPVVGYEPLDGCVLPPRIYYGVVTYVDSLGGEGTQCLIPFTIVVPAGNILTIESPNAVIGGGIGGNQVVYSGWNLYVGLSLGNYTLQNFNPFPIGTNYTEPITGINQGTVTVPNAVNIPIGGQNPTLAITSLGFLQTQNPGSPQPQSIWALVDTSGNWWNVSLSSLGILQTMQVPAGNPNYGINEIFLTDLQGVDVWGVTVQTNGLLQSTVLGPVGSFPFARIPPSSPTLQPLNAYVIQFRYYRARNPITAPTDVLQIPYIYKDIVVAGVNYLVSQYIDVQASLEPSQKTIFWKREFEDGLRQIRRDLRVNYRKTDFIAPDQATQYVVGNQQGIPTMGW